MGLDAFVFCNCYETGRNKTPPPPELEIIIAPDGSLACVEETLELGLKLDAWTYDQACEHEDGILLHHYIGNISLVAFLRKILQQAPDQLPILLTKVLYSGTHGGDYLTLQEVHILSEELKYLPSITSSNIEEQYYLERFQSQMSELVECALRLQKPIAF